jgi:hypothetical protein
MSDSARLKGIVREIDRLTKERRHVVVVAWTLPIFDTLARDLDYHRPLLCRDLFQADVLRSQLARVPLVAVALANTLSSDVKPVTSVPVEILVWGRNEMRSADDAIPRFADRIGANARVAFHLSLDDALLKDYVGTLSRFLAGLDVPQEEAISSAMVTRAITRAQKKKP